MIKGRRRQATDPQKLKKLSRYGNLTGYKLSDLTGYKYRRDGVVVRASALQSVDLGFIPLVESYQKTLKNGTHSFPAWRSAFMRGCGEQAGKFACCVLGQGT